MIVIPFSASDLAGVRWAPSPIFETLAWLRLTVDGRPHPLLGDPGSAARFALRHKDVAMVAEVVQGVSGYMPDLFTPRPPSGIGGRVLHDQLQRVQSTPQSTVHSQYSVVDESQVPLPVRRTIGSNGFAARIANGLYQFWRTALAENWKALEETLVADIDRRARVIALHGLGAALGSLHPGIGWHGDSLWIKVTCEPGFSVPPHRELVLAPSVLSWSVISAQVTDADNAVLTYPVSRLPEDSQRRPSASTSLLGRSRAGILMSLDLPRTTTELSRRLDLAPSTVSHHLAVLVSSGLATRRREGPVVRYRRTGEGETLTDALRRT